MIFKVNSAYFGDLLEGNYCDLNDYKEAIQDYLNILKPYTFIDNNQLCIEVNNLEDLNLILLMIQLNFKNIEDKFTCWTPTEVILDFKNKELTFRDYYLE